MKRRRFKSNLHLLLHHPLVFVRIYRWALLVLLIGAALDVATTIPVQMQLGPEVEVHPVGRLMTRLLGVPLGITLGKIIQTVVAIFVASLWRRACPWLLLTCGLLYTLAAASNYFGWL